MGVNVCIVHQLEKIVLKVIPTISFLCAFIVIAVVWTLKLRQLVEPAHLVLFELDVLLWLCVPVSSNQKLKFHSVRFLNQLDRLLPDNRLKRTIRSRTKHHYFIVILV